MDWENAANSSAPTVFYRTLNVEGLEIFYREAGPRDTPTVLLLHGFPSSSHMFRNLIPMLADTYHVIAPDFLGYGESSAPSVNDFDYSFERLASVTEKFTEKLNLSSYALYLSDIGASVGFRLAVMHPERVTAMIIQNGGAHVEDHHPHPLKSARGGQRRPPHHHRHGPGIEHPHFVRRQIEKRRRRP